MGRFYIDGKTIDDLNIIFIWKTLDGVKEVIIATQSYKRRWNNSIVSSVVVSEKGIETSRIANGLPIGSNIDYADELTLLKSLEGRKKI